MIPATPYVITLAFFLCVTAAKGEVSIDSAGLLHEGHHKTLPPRPPSGQLPTVFLASTHGESGQAATLKASSLKAGKSARLHAAVEPLLKSRNTIFEGHSVNDLGQISTYSLGASLQLSKEIELDLSYEDAIPDESRDRYVQNEEVNLRIAVRFW